MTGPSYRRVALSDVTRAEITVRLEEFTEPMLGGFGWTPAGSTPTINPPSPHILFSGTLAVPGEFKRGQYRIVIKEIENFPTGVGEPIGDLVERSVYADIFPHSDDDWFVELETIKP